MDDRRNGPGREHAPLLTRTEECQGRGELHGHDLGPPSPPSSPLPHTHTHQPELFELSFEEEPGGSWPDRMPTLSGPQAQVPRHTVQQFVDAVPLCLFSTILCRRWWQDIMRFFDTLLPDPEQVVEVPKILLDDVPMRTAVRDKQLAEQLVEVPTIVSYSWLQLSI